MSGGVFPACISYHTVPGITDRVIRYRWYLIPMYFDGCQREDPSDIRVHNKRIHTSTSTRRSCTQSIIITINRRRQGHYLYALQQLYCLQENVPCTLDRNPVLVRKLTPHRGVAVSETNTPNHVPGVGVVNNTHLVEYTDTVLFLISTNYLSIPKAKSVAINVRTDHDLSVDHVDHLHQ